MRRLLILTAAVAVLLTAGLVPVLANTKVDVCHNGQTINVDSHAVPAHLRHGDTEGPCEETGGPGEPTPTPDPTPVPWPCLGPGWSPGDKWGPGPLDIVPDAPPCDPEKPVPSGDPAPAMTLPPTDTE